MGFEAVVLFLILMVVILIGTPIGFGLGFAAIAGTLIFLSPEHLTQFSNIIYEQGTSMNQLVAPMFILMAEILAQTRVASDIFMILNKYLHKFRGGLAVSATLASTVFAALCGSSPATAAAIGRISINEMIKRHYKPSFAAGTVAAGGTLGIMIPPSLAMVVYGIITENSIAKLFIAGILPGLLISLSLITFILINARLYPEKVGYHQKKQADYKTDAIKTSLSQDLKLFVPPILLIVLILGLIYTGTATPTEASGVGSIGALLMAILLRRFNFKVGKSILTATARTSAMILFLIFGGMTLSYVVSTLGIAHSMAEYIIGLGVNKWVMLTSIYFLWFILGCLLDPMSMIILTIPFLYPTLIQLGFDPIWLGVVSTLCVEIGMITPPVGLNLFVIKGTSIVPMTKIISGVIPFLFVLILCLVILTVFPSITLYLPSLM